MCAAHLKGNGYNDEGGYVHPKEHCDMLGQFCPCDFPGVGGAEEGICASCDHPLATHIFDKDAIVRENKLKDPEIKDRELLLRERDLQLKERELQLKERSVDLEERAAKRHKPSPPDAFLCPITKKVMTDPVMLVETGQTFERTAIQEWLSAHDTCPIEWGKKLEKKDVLPVKSLKKAITEWGSGGVN